VDDRICKIIRANYRKIGRQLVLAKIYLASLINYPIVFIFNKVFGANIRKVKRRGIFWELDITEGIDFSIFIFGSFEKKTANTFK
jgi:hypothetical protein